MGTIKSVTFGQAKHVDGQARHVAVTVELSEGDTFDGALAHATALVHRALEETKNPNSMIRFVDLKYLYRTPLCAFLNTINNRFYEIDGTHVFSDMAGVRSLGEGFMALVPPGFFNE